MSDNLIQGDHELEGANHGVVHRPFENETEVKNAAIQCLRLGLDKGPYDYRPIEKWKGKHGVDLPLWFDYHDSRLVGMVECKSPIDPREGASYNSARKVIYTGLGQLLFHGRAPYNRVPLALFVGASDYDFARKKPVLTRARTPDGDALGPIVAERLKALNVHLILCARVGSDYVLDGESAFLEAVLAYAKRSPSAARFFRTVYGW